MDRPGLRDCLVAARSVHAAELAGEVVGLLRPRIHGFFRSTAPLTLQVFRAAREGRLIWRGPDSFAVLRAPADRVGAETRRLLRWADRHWVLVVLLGAFAVFVLSLLFLVALRGVLGRPVTLVAASVIGLLFVTFIAADQFTALAQLAGRGLRALGRDAPRPDEVAAESLPYEQWSLMLCHHVDGSGAAALLGAVGQRLTGMAGDNVVLACPTAAVTTAGMRREVARWADGLPTGVEQPAVSVRLPRRRPVRAHRVAETGAFFFVYLVLISLLLITLASSVAGWERSACDDVCAGRPATFTQALEWVRYRLVWQDPPQVRAVTFPARSTSVMIGVILPLTVLMAAGSLAHYRRYRAGLRREYLAMMEESLGRDRVLLVVATEVEREAVLRRAGSRPEDPPDFSAGHPVYRLGVIGGAEVLLAQCGPGITSPVSAAYSVPELIASWQPRYVVLLGICFGLREDQQRLGDVIVGRRLQVIKLRVGDETRDRGDVITAGHRLIERFDVAVPPTGVRVWQGMLLSWDVLVDSPPLREALKARYPDALGGEMEGAAVYAASVRAGTEWIVVKGICDWGQDKNDAAQERAAANAAAHVFNLIEARAFAYRPEVVQP